MHLDSIELGQRLRDRIAGAPGPLYVPACDTGGRPRRRAGRIALHCAWMLRRTPRAIFTNLDNAAGDQTQVNTAGARGSDSATTRRSCARANDRMTANEKARPSSPTIRTTPAGHPGRRRTSSSTPRRSASRAHWRPSGRSSRPLASGPHNASSARCAISRTPSR